MKRAGRGAGLTGRLACAAAAALVLAGGCAGPGGGSPTAVSGNAGGVAGEPSLDVQSLVISTSPWTFEAKDGQVVRTPSYRIYTTVSKPQLASRVPVFLERCLLHYTSALGELPRPGGEMETYMMANRPQWERVTQRVMGEQAEVYLKIQRGGFAANGRAVLYDIGPRDTFAIAAHEGWHQYTQKTFRAGLPVALEEGLATYMEGFRWDPEDPDRPRFWPWANFERFEQLRSSQQRGTLVGLARLQQSTPQEIIGESPEAALTYYAQVWALIHFLNEGGGGAYRAGLRKMLQDAASGDLMSLVRSKAGGRAAASLASKRTGVDLLEVYYGRSAESLDREYQEFIAKIVRVGARSKIAAGQSPVGE